MEGRQIEEREFSKKTLSLAHAEVRHNTGLVNDSTKRCSEFLYMTRQEIHRVLRDRQSLCQ